MAAPRTRARCFRMRVPGCRRTSWTLYDMLLLLYVMDTGARCRASYGELARSVGCYSGHVRNVAARLEESGLLERSDGWREDGGRDANDWALTPSGRLVVEMWARATAPEEIGDAPSWAAPAASRLAGCERGGSVSG